MAKNRPRPRSLGVGASGHTDPARRACDRMLDAIRELPPDATIEDAIERLVFLAKIEAGLAQLGSREGVSHEEAKLRLGL